MIPKPPATFSFLVSLLVFSSLCAVSVSADAECPFGYKFFAGTAICYHLSEQMYDFDGAVDYCQSTGGKLVSLIQGEKQAIQNLTSHLPFQPWIGSKRNTTTGVFYNIDRTTFIPGQWIDGEPTLTNGDCVTFKGVGTTFGLQTTQCYQTQFAFCKIVPSLCNGGVQNGTFGSIQSPQYPDQYYNKLLCYYYLYAPQGFQVNIYFPQINTERYYDFVELYEGNSTARADQIVALTGNLTEQVFSSKGNLLLVVFRTNYVITDTGFYATWNVQRVQPPIVANSTSSGELASPNYPADYDTFDKQLYYIEVLAGAQINVTIDDFVTQETFDYLEIYASWNQTATAPVARLSGNAVTLPWTWLSTSNQVSLKFVSDGSVQYKGWHLTWQMVQRK